MGFCGSYEIVKRKVSKLKNQRQALAYMRFETEPGYQAQVDFGEFQIAHADGHIQKLYLFAMILGYSRRIYAQLIERCDLPTFLDCHIKAFCHFGGVPAQILYDRMRNVYIGKLAGKTRFNDTQVGFALHYGFAPQVAPAYAAWVKGKIERPFSFIREGFWRGYSFLCLDFVQPSFFDLFRPIGICKIGWIKKTSVCMAPPMKSYPSALSARCHICNRCRSRCSILPTGFTAK